MTSLDFELRVFLRDVRKRIKSSSDLRFAILAVLHGAGICDIHIKDRAGGTPARGGGRKPAK